MIKAVRSKYGSVDIIVNFEYHAVKDASNKIVERPCIVNVNGTHKEGKEILHSLVPSRIKIYYEDENGNTRLCRIDSDDVSELLKEINQVQSAEPVWMDKNVDLPF